MRSSISTKETSFTKYCAKNYSYNHNYNTISYNCPYFLDNLRAANKI